MTKKNDLESLNLGIFHLISPFGTSTTEVMLKESAVMAYPVTRKSFTFASVFVIVFPLNVKKFLRLGGFEFGYAVTALYYSVYLGFLKKV